jgi:hypothetical protein
VRQRLEEAQRYWLATTRPDGRPHVVPIDGVWVDGLWYFGGHPATVHQRNLRSNTNIALHLEDAMSVVIVEGRAEWVTPSATVAKRLATVSNDKYGYGSTASAYRDGTWSLRPRVAIAWTSGLANATRFRFRGGAASEEGAAGSPRSRRPPPR